LRRILNSGLLHYKLIIYVFSNESTKRYIIIIITSIIVVLVCESVLNEMCKYSMEQTYSGYEKLSCYLLL